MPGCAMTVMPKTEEEKRDEAEVPQSAIFAQMLCYALHFINCYKGYH
jgi:hypothetical protein